MKGSFRSFPAKERDLLLSAFLPIWLLTTLGYLAARFALIGVDSAQVEAVLGRFVFRVAMPAALFGMLAKADLHALAIDPKVKYHVLRSLIIHAGRTAKALQPTRMRPLPRHAQRGAQTPEHAIFDLRVNNTSIVAFGVSTVATCLIGLAVSRRIFRRAPAEQAISGMAAGYVNSANLGIPVAVQILGSGSFVSTVILLQTVVVTPVILTLIDAKGQTRVRDIALLPLRNPIIIASALGAICSATRWPVPVDLAHSVALLGGAAVPTALMALGMSLHGRREERSEQKRVGAETAVVVLLKTVLQPVLAYLVGRFVFHLGAHDLLAVVLCAALPTAQNVFIYAREYELPTALPRDAVIFSTLMSMATLWLVVILLGTR